MIDDGVGNATGMRSAEGQTGSGLPDADARHDPRADLATAADRPIDLPRDIARDPPWDIAKDGPRASDT